MKSLSKYYPKKICLIGAGKVGSAIYHALSNTGFNFTYVIDPNIIRVKKIFTGNKNLKVQKSISGNVLKESEVIIISVQEKYLKEAINQILRLKISLKGKLIFHTSGVATSDIFNILPVEKRLTGSFHPLQTFRTISYNNNNILNNIYFGIEGGSEAIKYFKFICEKLNSNNIVINKKKKPLYHTACVVASNFLVTHFNILSEITKTFSDNKKDGINIFKPIVEKTLGNIFKSGTKKSLTGPFARGDIETIDLHLKYIKENIPSALYYYVMLGLETMNLSEKGKNINRKTAKEIEELLLNNT